MVYDPGATEYDDITSTTPVGKIVKITNTNPAKIHFSSYDFSKFKRGDMVYITRQDGVAGRSLFDMQTFALDNPNDKDLNYFLKTSEDKTIDASHLPAEVTGGFAQISGTVDETRGTAPPKPEPEAKSKRQDDDEPSSRKAASRP